MAKHHSVLANIINQRLSAGAEVYLDITTFHRKMTGRIIRLEPTAITVVADDLVVPATRIWYSDARDNGLPRDDVMRDEELDATYTLRRHPTTDGAYVVVNRPKKVSEEKGTKPTIVTFIEKRMAAGEPIFARLGRLRFYLRSMEYVQGQFEAGHWLLTLAQSPNGNTTQRRFYPSSADAKWKIQRDEDGVSWELMQRPDWVQPENSFEGQQVDEARKRKSAPAEPLDMKAELLMSLIDKEFQKERGIPTSINLFGRGLSGTLTQVQRNNDNTATLYAQMRDSATQEIWTSVMTVDNEDFKHINLTRVGGVLKLVGKKDSALDEERDNAEPFFLVMLRKLLNAGKTVYATSFDEGNNPMHALVKDAHFNEHFGTIDVDVEFEGADGTETDQFGYTESEAAQLKFKNVDDVWYIVDLDGNFR